MTFVTSCLTGSNIFHTITSRLSAGAVSFMIRIPAIITLCLAVLAANGLGLNRGMLLSVDERGHVRLASAFFLHAHAHAHGEGADHGSHEFPPDADHSDLHAAIEACSDAGLAKAQYGASVADSPRPTDTPAFPGLIAPSLALRPSLGLAGIPARTVSATAAHPELALLGSVVLLV